jgi:hypothetical protein
MRSVLCATLILLCATAGFSASLEEFIGPERAAALRPGGAGTIVEVQLKNPQAALIPRHEGIRQLTEEIQRSLQPSLMVESLALYVKPQGSGAAPDKSEAAAWTEAERAELFNQALALSSLAGIQYYSASRGTMRTFYETSQVIDAPDTRRPLADPSRASPPARLDVYARQKDLTFGDNIYRYEYRSYPDAFLFIQENVTAMNAGIIPAVGKNKLRSLMAVFDCGEYLLIYAASMAKAASLPGMGERIGNSFTNRAQAILKWFAQRADLVFGNAAG